MLFCVPLSRSGPLVALGMWVRCLVRTFFFSCVICLYSFAFSLSFHWRIVVVFVVAFFPYPLIFSSSVLCVMYRFNGIVFFFILYFSLFSIIISRNLVHDSSIPWIHRLLRLARLVCTVNWVLVLFCFLFSFFHFYLSVWLYVALYSVCSLFSFRFMFVNIYSSSKFLNLLCHLFHLSIIFSTVRFFWYISNEMIRVSGWRWNFCCCSVFGSIQCIFR